jgi:hypothetical protein
MIDKLTRHHRIGHNKKVVTNAVLFLGYCTGNITGPFFLKTSSRKSLYNTNPHLNRNITQKQT